MKLFRVIFLSLICGIAVGATGTTIIYASGDERQKNYDSAKAFQAADLDSLRKEMKEHEALKQCKDKLLKDGKI